MSYRIDDYGESFTGEGGTHRRSGGFDSVGMAVPVRPTLDLTTGTVTNDDYTDQLTSIEWVSASNFSDTLLGSEVMTVFILMF